MPSHVLFENERLVFPINSRHDFRGYQREVFNRYYSAYVRRLQSVGYRFPAVHPTGQAFGRDLQASFVWKQGDGFCLDPGPHQRWLVFVVVGGELLILVARYIVRAKNAVQFFGNGSSGVQYGIDEDDDVVSGFAVPWADISDLSMDEAFVL